MRPRLRTPLLLPVVAALVALSPLAPASAREAAAVRAEPTWADLEVRRLETQLEADLAQPRALVDLQRLSALIDDVTDLPALRGAFLKAAWNRRAHGEVRAYARLGLARVAWRRGRRPEAERWIRTLGAVRTGAFVGPFDNEGGAGFDAAYAPETDEAAGTRPDPDQALTGKEHPVRWRTLPDVAPLGWVDLGPLVTPSQEVVVYVRFELESARGGPAWLRLASPGPTKIWVGGKLVHEDPADHPARFDQNAVPVTLAAGRTPVLLKLTQREGGSRSNPPDSERTSTSSTEARPTRRS